jgi:hypothetical protein
LTQCKETGAARRRWIEERLRALEPKAEQASRALMFARAAAPRIGSAAFYKSYVFELDYVAARFDGILSLYRAHLVADSEPARAAALFRRAQADFTAVRELFRGLDGYRMAKLRELEPTVPFTAAFLRDWETRGYWEPRSRWFHVVWERLDEFEELVRKLRPKGLAPEE